MFFGESSFFFSEFHFFLSFFCQFVTSGRRSAAFHGVYGYVGRGVHLPAKQNHTKPSRTEYIFKCVLMYLYSLYGIGKRYILNFEG